MATIDPQAMTLDECRDWLAEQDGWHWLAGVEGDPVWCNVEALKTWDPAQVNHPEGSQYEHPFPATLDGAAGALPEAWFTIEQTRFYDDDDSLDWAVAATRPGLVGRYCVRAWATDEITARYRLAVACRLADREGKQDQDDGA